MTRSQQIATNAICKNVFATAMNEFDNSSKMNLGKLRNCTAEVLETENYFFLRSYNTIIAVMYKWTGECFDVLRMVYGYTATSAQHIAKFARDYHETNRYTYRDV